MKDVLPKGFVFDCLLEFGIFLPSNECVFVAHVKLKCH